MTNILKVLIKIGIFVLVLLSVSLLFRTAYWSQRIANKSKNVWLHRDNIVNSLSPFISEHINFEPKHLQRETEKRILSLKREAKTLKEKLHELQDFTLKKFPLDEKLIDTPVQNLVKQNYQEPPMVYQNYDYILCGRSTLKLLILVFTEYEEKKERELIRNTWGNLLLTAGNKKYELRWKKVFVIGRSYHVSSTDVQHSSEVILKRDILNVHSDRTNTMGTMYGALYWAANACAFENLLVIRPKMFVNIHAMYNLLHTETKPRNNFYIKALLYTNTTRLRNALSANNNIAWMASNDLIIKLLRISKIHTASNFPLNDQVYLNYMDGLKAERYDIDNFMTEQHVCQFKRDYVLNTMSSMGCHVSSYEEYKLRLKIHERTTETKNVKHNKRDE